ncbi:O-methyltransferase [Bombardia bombarda]|uniref:O-methyltransferase n=1 Tax=Bombardia bombarda TaxID=252184 RepID=A0AA39X8T4_9PEZI|nr:O-methyltransferase [Bombardia bombarda]
MPNATPNTPVDVALASTPCDMDNVPLLVSSITALSERLAASNSHEDRLQLLAKAHALVRALETPRETMIRHLWASDTANASLAIGYESGLFAQMAQGGGIAKTAAELAQAIGWTDTSFLARILRHLAATGYIVETGPDEYLPTRFTNAMTIPMIGASYPFVLRTATSATAHLPEYIKPMTHSSGSKNRDTSTLSAFQVAHSTTLNVFEYTYSIGLANAFNLHLAGSSAGVARWFDQGFYPVEDRLLAGISNKSEGGGDVAPVLLVDMGGGKGWHIKEFGSRYAHVIREGGYRLVLQDLPSVVDDVSLDPNSEEKWKVETMAHDFFEEQPIRGARAYSLNRVLHDWEDEQCRQILHRIKDAMRPGYSRLLINEVVVPRMGAKYEVTSQDLCMFMFTRAKERTEQDWYELLERDTGLKIRHIWSVANATQSLIECEVV